MSKRTLYLIFIAKFLFSISLIAWTVSMTLGAGVGKDEDNTFMSYYHDVDQNFNNIMINNTSFQKKYDLEIKINDFAVDSLTYDDIFLPQRAIQSRKIRKGILHVGVNKVYVVVKNKETKREIKDVNTSILFTMPSTHDFNQEINISQADSQKDFILTKKSYWNVMGKIKVGNDIGNFYIKTNAI